MLDVGKRGSKVGVKRFWAQIEGLPWERVEEVWARKLRRQLGYLEAHSEFYRRKFKQAKVQIKKIRNAGDLKYLPFTTKEEIRQSLGSKPPLGLHQAAPMREIIRIHSSTGTTGQPSYMGITRHDYDVWTEIVSRVYYTHGLRQTDICVHAFGLGFFVGGLPIQDGIEGIGTTLLPLGLGQSERLIETALRLKANAITCTPSYALYLPETARRMGISPKDVGLKKFIVGAEPGGGIPEIRARIQETWGCKVVEGLGNSDISPVIWAECPEQRGMHLCAQEFVIAEIIDHTTGVVLPIEDGVEGEVVYTAIDREASPLLRFRTNDHVVVWTEPCACGRTAPRVRCVGRYDDMLIVKGVNVFPSAIQDVVSSLRPKVTGAIEIQLTAPGPRVEGPLKINVEGGEAITPREYGALRKEVIEVVKKRLYFTPEIMVVSPGSLPKYELKAKLIRKVYEEKA
jgi:phenylacetate-CoA ligase